MTTSHLLPAATSELALLQSYWLSQVRAVQSVAKTTFVTCRTQLAISIRQDSKCTHPLRQARRSRPSRFCPTMVTIGQRDGFSVHDAVSSFPSPMARVTANGLTLRFHHLRSGYTRKKPKNIARGVFYDHIFYLCALRSLKKCVQAIYCIVYGQGLTVGLDFNLLYADASVRTRGD